MGKYRFRPGKKIILKTLNGTLNNFHSTVKFSFPQRGTREDFMYNGTFHEAISFVLATAQLFGIMPVSGIRGKTPRDLKFRKFSFRFVLCLVYMFGLFWIMTMDVLWIYRTRIEFGKLINFVFDFTNLISLFCFLELARKWPQLMLKWNEVEKFLPQLKYQMDKQKMAYEIKMVSFMILFISMGELRTFQIRPWITFEISSGTSSFNHRGSSWR